MPVFLRARQTCGMLPRETIQSQLVATIYALAFMLQCIYIFSPNITEFQNFFYASTHALEESFPPLDLNRESFPPLIFLIEQEIIFDCKRILYNVVSVYRKGSIFRSCFLKQSDSKHPLLPPI